MANKLLNLNSSDNILMNDGRFKQLSSPDLDDIKYSYVGYVTSSTNAPSSANRNGELLCMFNSSGTYGYQIYKAYNGTVIYHRTFNSTWTDWIILSNYGANETITLSGWIECIGMVSVDGKSIYFTIPVGLPKSASGVTFSKLVILVRGINGSALSNTDVIANSTYSVTSYFRSTTNTICVQVSGFTDLPKATPICVEVGNGTSFTFS